MILGVFLGACSGGGGGPVDAAELDGTVDALPDAALPDAALPDAALVDLELSPVAADADAVGHVVFSFATAADIIRLTRVSLATGTIDPTFGTTGRLTVTFPPVLCTTSRDGPGYRWRGVFGDGTLVFDGQRACSDGSHAYPQTVSAHYYY